MRGGRERESERDAWRETETERREGREGSALCMTCGVMSMVMKTKDGRQVRESARGISNLGEYSEEYSEKRASKSK